MANKEVKWGAILSYLLIIMNTVYGFFIAPFILSTIGKSEYGVYKTISSMTATLAVIDLGIGSTIQRYVAKFNSLNDKETSSNYTAMALIQVFVLGLITAVVSFALFFSVEGMYKASFSADELYRAKQLFIIQAIYMVLHVFENAFYGIITGYNKFVFSNSLKLALLLFRVVFYLFNVTKFKNSLIIVFIALCLEVVIILVEFIFIKFKLKHKIKLKKWDKALFKESFLYTILLFIQSIVIQFNGNIDNIVIGAYIGTAAVTVYSFALQIFGMYEQCSTAMSGVVLPTISDKIYSGADEKDLSNTVYKFGRVQWIVLGAVLIGFITCGQEFFSLWLGPDFNDAYYLALILMIPVTFPLIVNVCLTILKVKNLLKFRTLSLVYSTVINALITIIGVNYFGYWAAAVGTALSTVIGSIISLNIYYYKKLRINVIRLYFSIFKNVTFAMLIAGAICILLNQFMFGTWVSLIIKIMAFIVVYGVCLILFGLNSEEKKVLFNKTGIKRS